MKLYGVALSPFVRKAMLALEHKGISYDNEPTFPGDTSPAFRAISPLGKVPVLEHDGFAIPDTSVICRYLERIHPDQALYPSDPQAEAQVLWLEEYADSRLVEACAGLFRERVRFRFLTQGRTWMFSAYLLSRSAWSGRASPKSWEKGSIIITSLSSPLSSPRLCVGHPYPSSRA